MDISIIKVTKHYGSQVVLKNFCCCFPEGKITCLLGASGVGKTTLLRLILGLESMESGKITGIKGKRYGVLFQEDRLLEELDAVKNIMAVWNRKLDKQQIEKDFNRIGLKEYKEKPVSQLSGGMKRRVALVRAFAGEPSIVILDEPWKGLDEENKKKALYYTKEKSVGKTVIIVTHDRTDNTILGAGIVEMSQL